MVKAAVLVKQVPDTEEVRIDDKTREPDASRAERVVSQYDKHAVETAVGLQEDGAVDETVAISLGPEGIEESLREVLAMGIDEAVAIEAPDLDEGGGLGKAEALARAVEHVGDVDLVFASEESADSHTASTGPMVAEFLDASLLSYVYELSLDGDSVEVKREVDEGLETLRSPFPAVVTVVEAINDPRLPALTQILQAKNKPLETLSAEDLGVETARSTEMLENIAPEETRKQEIVELSDAREDGQWLLDELQSQGAI